MILAVNNTNKHETERKDWMEWGWDPAYPALDTAPQLHPRA